MKNSSVVLYLARSELSEFILKEEFYSLIESANVADVDVSCAKRLSLARETLVTFANIIAKKILNGQKARQADNCQLITLSRNKDIYSQRIVQLESKLNDQVSKWNSEQTIRFQLIKNIEKRLENIQQHTSASILFAR